MITQDLIDRINSIQPCNPKAILKPGIPPVGSAQFPTPYAYAAYRHIDTLRMVHALLLIEDTYQKNTHLIDGKFKGRQQIDSQAGIKGSRAGRSKSACKSFQKELENMSLGLNALPRAAWDVWMALKYGISKSPRSSCTAVGVALIPTVVPNANPTPAPTPATEVDPVLLAMSRKVGTTVEKLQEWIDGGWFNKEKFLVDSISCSCHDHG